MCDFTHHELVFSNAIQDIRETLQEHPEALQSLPASAWDCMRYEQTHQWQALVDACTELANDQQEHLLEKLSCFLHGMLVVREHMKG